MSNAQFSDIGACVFDAYGTLFDFNSAVEGCRDKLGDKADLLSATWRQKQLQYTWLRSLMGKYEDFWTITGDALDFALSAANIDDPSLRAELMQLYLELDPYPEVVETLAALKDARIKTAVLSNGSQSMLVSAAKNAGVSKLIDFMLSVFTSRIPRSISSPSTSSTFRPIASVFNRLTPGTPAAPPHLVSALPGSIGSANSVRPFPASPTRNSDR